MKPYDRIIFVGQTGACREVMAAGILKDFTLKRPILVEARGLVVLFSEPVNQKAEAVLISNGIEVGKYTSRPLEESDFTEHTLVITMQRSHKKRILEQYEHAVEEDVQVLTELVGDELEIMDPYGGSLSSYGLCYEALRGSIKKLVKKLNEE